MPELSDGAVMVTRGAWMPEWSSRLVASQLGHDMHFCTGSLVGHKSVLQSSAIIAILTTGIDVRQKYGGAQYSYRASVPLNTKPDIPVTTRAKTKFRGNGMAFIKTGHTARPCHNKAANDAITRQPSQPYTTALDESHHNNYVSEAPTSRPRHRRPILGVIRA